MLIAIIALVIGAALYVDENIDINKNYKYITINNDYDKNIFVTNRVEELDKIMEKYVNDNDDDISDAEIARVM